MFTILTRDSLFYISSPPNITGVAPRRWMPPNALARHAASANSEQVLLCCRPQPPAVPRGRIYRGNFFPSNPVPWHRCRNMLLLPRFFYICHHCKRPPRTFLQLSLIFAPFFSTKGSWIDKDMLLKYYGASQVSKSLRITSCLATSLLRSKAQEFICAHPAHASPAARGNLVAVLFRIHGSITCPRLSAYLRSVHLIIHSLS